MVIRQFKRLSALRKEQIASLERECLEADGAVCPVFAEPFLNYTTKVPAFFFATSGNRAIGVLSLFLPGDGTAEVSAVVAPTERKKGVFKALLKTAGQSIKQLDIATVYLVSCPGVPDCDACLSAVNALYSSSEFKMFLPKADAALALLEKGSKKAPPKKQKDGEKPVLLPVSGKDIPSLSPLLGDFFNTDPESAGTWLNTILGSEKTHFFKLILGKTLIGCGGYVDSGKSASVFGIGIEKSHRGAGFGRFLMRSILVAIPSGHSVVLQVSDKNAVAFSLYKSLGFEVTATTRYHILPMNR
ncbi:MAG: GNAT family N-acetyltransferase [Lachnospiraceae bacterium]|nr:GNAT family N-acetyltransferase [Lachnospiraceae bacterium]